MTKKPNDSGKMRFWKSIKEYRKDPETMQELHEAAKHEFPADIDKPTPEDSGLSRRTFLGLMSATAAVAATSCRRPDHKIVPAVKGVEYRVPGLPTYYTTVYSEGNVATGLVVKQREGRPVKIEGNAEHIMSGGKSTSAMQAELLSLYDPDRMVGARINEGANTPPTNVLRSLSAAIKKAASSGKQTRILIDRHASPSLSALTAAFEAAIPSVKFVTMPDLGHSNAAIANNAMFGIDAEFVADLSKADVILSVDRDFAGSEPMHGYHFRQYSTRRKPTKENPEMNLSIVAESRMSITGMNADKRFKMRPQEYAGFIGSVLSAVASATGNVEAAALAASAPKASGDVASNAKQAAQALLGAGSTGFIQVGSHLDAGCHAMANAINLALGSLGTGAVVDPSHTLPNSNSLVDAHAEFAAELDRGAVGCVVFAGVNPSYSATADMKRKLASVAEKYCLNMHDNETAAMCGGFIPMTHFLESWGDALSFDGTLTVQQPLIAPLNESSLSLGDMLLQLAKEHDGALDSWLQGMETEYELSYTIENYCDVVRARWEWEWWNSDEGLGDTFLKHWEKALMHGVYHPVEMRPAPVELTANAANARSLVATSGVAEASMTLVVTPSYQLYDGRFANNGWAQEMPDPVTKVAWDNVVSMSEATATELGVEQEDVVTIATDAGTLDLPVYVQAGMVDGVLHTTTGFGRTKGGTLLQGVGGNAFSLLNGEMITNVTAQRTGAHYGLAISQGHNRIDVNPGDTEKEKSRKIVFQMNLSQMSSQAPDQWFERAAIPGRPDGKDRFTLPLSANRKFEYKGHRWGMTIDLSACSGCNACVTACYAENNIAMVGKDQISRGRHMQWMRLDRYYQGSPDNPETVIQPMLCQHCENAPCENVCPVAATTHSPEGLNEMTYNRCVGTRYCLNNCPYKVRRYNYLNYHTHETDPWKFVYNPDVTVRMRGIMEKCSFCVQRITAAKYHAADQGRSRVKDGEVVTACQQACPAGAIYFGDTNDESSMVNQRRHDERGFLVLEEINTRPQITYLAKVRNDALA